MSWNIDTKCIQEGWKPENGEPRVLPIYQSTTFKYDSAQHMADLFDLKASGFFYSRLANPTVDAVEKKIASLEGGVAAMLTSSGQAATMMAVFNICPAGGHVISSSAIYGGTFNLFNKTMREMGIDFTFVDPCADEETIRKAFKPNTRAVFIETLANPSLIVTDIEKFANLAHENGVPLLVDNTFPTPINCRPFEFGADIVIHSTTKYMDGHGCSLGGAIVDSGKFDWKNGKFPEMTTPDDTYHGLVYADHAPIAYILKARAHLMRDTGVMASPQNAFLLNIGLETLHLRMERHCSNALKIAKYLQNHDMVEWVNYPGLENNENYALAQKYMPNGTSGVISFGLKGGREAGVKFLDSLNLIALVTHVADARTCMLHPASTTHRQLSDDELKAAGVSPGLLRLSVGIEHADDLIADIEQAMANA